MSQTAGESVTVEIQSWHGVNQIVGERLRGWRGARGHRLTRNRLMWAQLGARMLASELGILEDGVSE